MSKKNIQIAVIGAGRIGKMHCENILNYFPEISIVGIAVRRPEQIKNWARKQGISHVTNNHSELINHPAVDAVMIFSSTNSHGDLIIEAAEAGKNIFCEKPIADSIEKIIEVLNAVHLNRVKMQIGFNRRFDPSYAALKKSILEGKIGYIHMMRLTSRDPEPPPLSFIKTSGGMLMDLTTHDFDMARFLSDSEIEEVTAMGSVMIDQQIDEVGDIDTAMVMLKLKNGVLVSVDNSRKASYGYDQRIEVFGSEGQIAVDNVYESNLTIYTATGRSTDKPKSFFLDRYTKSYIQELKYFFEALQKDTPVAVSGNDGLLSVLGALAAQLSMKEKRVVTIDEMKEKFGIQEEGK